MSRSHEYFMNLAIQEAKKGIGKTSPNPIVGAVLVKNGRVLAKGYHAGFGGPHAEISVLNGTKQNFKNAVLYVTLEPCSTFGKTPPCTKTIISSQISKVIIGCLDPNPKHYKRGVSELKKSGIPVVTDILRKECEELNPGFKKWIQNKMPYCIVKSGLSLDGKIAASSGESKWITNSLSRKRGYALRAQTDAVMVGIETVLADNPSLCLHGKKTAEPFKIVVDTNGRIPASSQLVKKFGTKTIVAAADISASKEKLLRLSGVKIFRSPKKNGRVDLKFLFKKLALEGITSVLVEGGGELAASIIEDRLADKLYYFYAPILIGGRQAKLALAGKGCKNLNRAPRLKNMEIERIGSDLLMSGDIIYSCSRE